MQKFYTSLLTIIFIAQSNLFADIKFNGVGGSLNVDQSTSSLSVDTAINNFSGISKIRTAGSAENPDNLVSTSGNINFSEGIIQIGNNASAFTGTYVPGANNVDDTITLGNDQKLDMFSGDTLPQAITINTTALTTPATINGTTFFASAITLANATSALNLSLRNKLNRDIALGGGKVILLDDLKMKDAVRFTGTGTVDINNRTLEIGASTAAWNNTTLTFQRAKDIQLNGRTALTGTWSFQTDGTDKESILNGNGNVLDLTGGGIIQVGQDHTLYISDVHIKGVGGAAGFDLFNHATTPGKIVLSKVTIELAANYTLDSGVINVKGDIVTVISGGQYTFTVDGANTVVNVDNVALYYETLGGTNTSPFATANSGTINTINGGVIRSNIANAQPVDTIIDAGTVSSYAFNKHLDLRTIEKIVINNSIDPTTTNITIDGSNYTWTFPVNIGNVITIANKTIVTLTNVRLKNFNFNSCSLGTDSELRFGDGVIVECLKVPTSSTNYFNCVGNVRIVSVGEFDGFNANRIKLTLLSPDIAANTKTVTLENFTLQIDMASPFLNNNFYGKFVLKNCNLMFIGNNNTTTLGFPKGSLEIDGCCKIDGLVVDNPNGVTIFDWTSTGTFKIKSGATLTIGNGINFRYNPAILPSDNNWSASKRRFVLEDSSSTLFCDNCTLTSTATGFALDRGNLIINNKVILNSSTNDIEGAELGSALNIEVLAASILDIDGSVQYNLTTA